MAGNSGGLMYRRIISQCWVLMRHRTGLSLCPFIHSCQPTGPQYDSPSVYRAFVVVLFSFTRQLLSATIK